MTRECNSKDKFHFHDESIYTKDRKTRRQINRTASNEIEKILQY